MRSNAGMPNRQGDVDLRFAQVSAPVKTLAWLGLVGRDVKRYSVWSPEQGLELPREREIGERELLCCVKEK